MKRTAIYPGSFNPFHVGHERVVRHTLETFDKVIVAIGSNPKKDDCDLWIRRSEVEQQLSCLVATTQVEVIVFKGLLADYVNTVNAKKKKIFVVVKGLRNHVDLEDERYQLYNNQDLGLKIPTLYILADRDVSHISSTSIRTIESFKKDK